MFDPRLTQDFIKAVDCGIIALNAYPITKSSTAQLVLEQQTIADDVGAIDLPKTSCNAKSFSKYNTYTYQLNEIGGAVDVIACTHTSSNFKGPCFFDTYMTMSSMLVTTQTSTRATDWKKILLDEGSIVGGITFLTWFLSIYVI